MIGRLHLKIGFLIVLLIGLVSSQASFAKGAHAQRHTDASAKLPNSVHTNPTKTIDTSVTVLPPRGRFAKDKQNSDANLKIIKPGNLTRRSNVTAPIKPSVVRNAIGQLVNAKSLTADTPRLAPSLQTQSTVAKAGVRSSSLTPPILRLDAGSSNVHSTATASISSKGRIDGAHLIRPSVDGSNC